MCSLTLTPTFQASLSQHKMEVGEHLPTFLSPKTDPHPQPGGPPVGLHLPTPGVSREGGQGSRKERKPHQPQGRDKTCFLLGPPKLRQQTPALLRFSAVDHGWHIGPAGPGAVSAAGHTGSALRTAHACLVLQVRSFLMACTVHSSPS